MFSKLYRREKKKVYLGRLVVAPRGKFETWDSWGLFKSEDLEGEIRSKLEGLFSLPTIDERSEPKKSDLALEVVVLKLQGGEFEFADLGSLGGFPVFWRPKIEVAARLYNIESGKTHASSKAKEKMPWSQYLSGVLSFRGLFRYKPIFGVSEIEPLLYRACEKILVKLASTV